MRVPDNIAHYTYYLFGETPEPEEVERELKELMAKSDSRITGHRVTIDHGWDRLRVDCFDIGMPKSILSMCVSLSRWGDDIVKTIKDALNKYEEKFGASKED
jgi:hypothetical protein